MNQLQIQTGLDFGGKRSKGQARPRRSWNIIKPLITSNFIDFYPIPLRNYKQQQIAHRRLLTVIIAFRSYVHSWFNHTNSWINTWVCVCVCACYIYAWMMDHHACITLHLQVTLHRILRNRTKLTSLLFPCIQKVVKPVC